VAGDRLELRPGAGVENELSAQLGAVFVFQMTLAPAHLLLGIVRGMSDLSDYAAMVISHNRLIGGKQGPQSCTALCAATLSKRHEVLRCTKQVEITLADPVFDPQRHISRKFFWCHERLISANGME
jgi:hypothetical protein